MKEFAKIDVGLREHPKVLRAGDEAAWLYVNAILWSKQHDTDGHVPGAIVPRLTGLRKPWDAVEQLVKVGLFELGAEDSYEIHDYLEHQESAEERRGKRHAASVAGRKGAAKRWNSEPYSEPYSDPHGERYGVAIAEEEEEEEEEEETPKTPSSSELDRARLARELFGYWQKQCGHPNAKATRERLTKVQARLRQGYTPEQIRSAIDGAARAPYIDDNGKRFDDLELICRNGSKLESFIGRQQAQNNHRPNGPTAADFLALKGQQP